MSRKFIIFPTGFPEFEIGSIESLPQKAREDIEAITEYLNRVLIDEEYLEMVYPVNGEIEITVKDNINDTKYKNLGEIIYDFCHLPKVFA